MTQKPDTIISIDPDVEKSGVAVLGTLSRHIELHTFPFPVLMDYLRDWKETQGITSEPVRVVVEAGWLNKTHWHLTARDTARLAASKGNSTGRNHEVGRKIVEMSRHYGLDTVEMKPLRKCWSGRDGKITHDELAQFIPGLPKHSNQEERDAALLAWTYAGLPIIIKVKRKL